MRSNDTSALVDGLLRASLLGGTITAGMFAPNSLQPLNKHIHKLIKHLDNNAYQREVQKTLRYMRQQGLIEGDYEHGLQITAKGRKRLVKRDEGLDSINFDYPANWDNKWRLLIYDIPESKKSARDKFALKIRQSGFIQLQKSFWVFPHDCRQQINKIATMLDIDSHVTYIVCEQIDNQEKLIERFKLKNVM